MKDKNAREAIKVLAHTLGISAQENYDGLLVVDKYSNIHGGEPDLRPLTRKDFDDEGKLKPKYNLYYSPSFKKTPQIEKDFAMLLGYLGLEMFDGKEIRKKIAPEEKNKKDS